MQVVITHKMRKEMLEKAHVSHQGTEVCIRRAKDVIHWPGMTAEIQQQVSQCMHRYMCIHMYIATTSLTFPSQK